MGFRTGQQHPNSFLFHLYIFLQLYCPIGISPRGNSGYFLQGKPATQPTVHAGCFSVPIIHQTLTQTAESLACAQVLMHAIAHGGVQTLFREFALKVDSGTKIPCHSRESNLHQWHVGPMLYRVPSPLQSSCGRKFMPTLFLSSFSQGNSLSPSKISSKGGRTMDESHT